MLNLNLLSVSVYKDEVSKSLPSINNTFQRLQFRELPEPLCETSGVDPPDTSQCTLMDEDTDILMFEELSWCVLVRYTWVPMVQLGTGWGGVFQMLVIVGRSCWASWPSLRHGGSSVPWTVKKLSHYIMEFH